MGNLLGLATSCLGTGRSCDTSFDTCEIKLISNNYSDCSARGIQSTHHVNRVYFEAICGQMSLEAPSHSRAMDGLTEKAQETSSIYQDLKLSSACLTNQMLVGPSEECHGDEQLRTVEKEAWT